jgi:hypothetical protein
MAYNGFNQPEQKESYPHYVGRLIRETVLGTLAFGSKTIDRLVSPTTTIIDNDAHRKDPDKHRPFILDSVTGNNPNHPNHAPRYARV